jgi:ATP-dependent Lon protease
VAIWSSAAAAGAWRSQPEPGGAARRGLMCRAVSRSPGGIECHKYCRPCAVGGDSRLRLDEETDDVETIALFPLELVLLPGETVPLHIFEERYRRLMAALRSEGGEFGMVLAEDDKIHDTGCSAVLAGVTEEFDDGRLNVVVEGRRRFRVVELQSPDDPDTETLQATVSFFEDGDQGSSESRDEALAAFAELIQAMGLEQPQLPGGATPLSFRLAAAVDFGTVVKQALLESVSETERLAQLAAVIKTLLPRVEAQLRRSEAIRGNGKGM